MLKKMFRILFVVVLVLGILHSTKAQGLNNIVCGRAGTFIPLFPQVFYLDLDNPDFRVCPPVGIMQDAVVCIPRMSSTEYSIIGSGGADANTCMLVDADIGSFCTLSGNFDAIAIQLTALNSSDSGFVEVSSESSSVKVTFIYGPTLTNSIPLSVQSVPSLDISKSVVIVDKIFGQIGTMFYHVCEILSNGSSLPRGDFIGKVGPVPDCALANGTAALKSRPSSITLQSLSPFTPEETVALFLTSSTTCSESSARITEPFNVTLVNATDPTTTTTPTSQPVTDVTSPSTLSPGTIAGIAAAVVSPVIVVLIALLVALLLWRIIKRRNKPHDDLTPEGSSTALHDAMENGHHLPVAPPLTPISGIEDTDSGVGSPGPSTPQLNCAVAVLDSDNHPWYQEIMNELQELFKMPVKELPFPEDSSSQHDFELNFYGKEHHKHFLIFQPLGKPIPPALKEFIGGLESRGCHSPEVWIIMFGAQSEAVLSNSNINRLCIRQGPGKGESSECARKIFEEVSRSIATSGETTDGLTTRSHDPSSFAQHKDTEKHATASVPLPKRKFPQEDPHNKLMKRAVDAQERQAEATEKTAEALEKFAEVIAKSTQHTTKEINSLNRTAKSTKSAVDHLHETVDSIHSSTKRSEAMLESKAIREDDEQIVEAEDRLTEDT